jgi:hypothetical protein
MPENPKRSGQLRDRMSSFLGSGLELSSPGTIGSPRRRRIGLLLCSATIFLSALGVRLLYWHDSFSDESGYSSLNGQVVYFHLDEARRILGGGGVLFPRGEFDKGDARMVVHPPGYAILMAALQCLKASSTPKVRVELVADPLRWIQIVLDSVAAVIVFWISAEMAGWVPALIAGLLVALSPHLAYYSLFLSPDSLAVVPILAAVYLFARNVRRPRLATSAAVGLMIGVSCWLRSNALLLAPWLSVITFLLLDRSRRLRYAVVVLAGCVLVVAPLTFRNWVVYRRVIPLSIGSGITLVEGIADYDSNNRFGLPRTDLEVEEMDVEWHHRPDYAANLWVPDGIERDHDRFERGLAIVRSNPIWFGGLMVRRMNFMLRYNDFSTQTTVFTTIAPTVSGTPASRGQPNLPDRVDVGRPEALWTQYYRIIIGSLQRKIFKTWTMRLLILFGIVALAVAGRTRDVVLLLAVPAYYLCFQSALHTEYRYGLVIHYLLFIAAGVTLFLIGSRLRQGCEQVLLKGIRASGHLRHEH